MHTVEARAKLAIGERGQVYASHRLLRRSLTPIRVFVKGQHRAPNTPFGQLHLGVSTEIR